MNISEEMAVRLHRMMWSDMQRELGDRPTGRQRKKFKYDWIRTHFPDESIANDCWLCEYASSVVDRGDNPYCVHCPIKWPNCHCNTLDYSFLEEPINDILALPVKNKELVDGYIANDEVAVARSYYEYREQLLSKASGIPASLSIEDHVKAIREKAMQQSTFSVMYCEAKTELAKASGLPEADGIIAHIKVIQEKAVQQSNLSKIYGDTKMELAKASGLKAADTTTDHIKEIKEKAVEEYFAKTPGAKLATMDVDQAFKQYADEQKAPIFRALAEASGLSAGNESVKAHISEISSKAKSKGRAEMATKIFETLYVYSGVSKDIWSVGDHVDAIREKASNEKEIGEIREKLKETLDKLCRYRTTLSNESTLPPNALTEDHIAKIREYAFSDGQDAERERIMDKIGEMLNDKPTGTCKDI